MTLSLSNTGLQSASASYYSKRWRTAVEHHTSFLLNHSETTEVSTLGLKGYRTRYDLFAFLAQEGVTEKWHWTIMRINGFASPTDFDEETLAIYVPSNTVLEELYGKVMK